MGSGGEEVSWAVSAKARHRDLICSATANSGTDIKCGGDVLVCLKSRAIKKAPTKFVGAFYFFVTL